MMGVTSPRMVILAVSRGSPSKAVRAPSASYVRASDASPDGQRFSCSNLWVKNYAAHATASCGTGPEELPPLAP